MRIAAVFLALLPLILNGEPILKVHRGHINVNELGSNEMITSYDINHPYTFEVFLDNTMEEDYMINKCYMNDRLVIGKYGCVQCGQCVSNSIETEAYNKPGAVKRTLVQFTAHSSRSCQRSSQIFLSHYNYVNITKEYPPAMYGGDSYVMPMPHPNIYPTPFFGHGGMMGPPVVAAPPGAATSSQYGVTQHSSGTWPWWIWLLLLLLLLLLLCCLLALCLAAWWRRKKMRETTTTTVSVVDTGKECGVGTDKVDVHCVATDTQDIVKIQPAIALGTEEFTKTTRMRHHGEYEDSAAIAGGAYSIREGRVHEGFTRTIPRDVYASNDRYDRQFAGRDDRYGDRSSYRNFAYERDMGRVEPLDGYDEVETRERTYCLSDDEQEIVEKDVKRTHTTRYVQETREFDDGEERFRGNEHHHAPYTHSLPV
ncbi:unnamed protein product [Caenorhabditis bovis]|uniref:Uncharacterized protein n=1 Tax=Caenorhabditis bovis TaxID=2654633 RepID=A0A8S1ENU6_9PELO|nr:unnamed protein product [Caenorhabditis bovis]